jgi:hypothetical protein
MHTTETNIAIIGAGLSVAIVLSYAYDCNTDHN